jgi:hypothetical protein
MSTEHLSTSTSPSVDDLAVMGEEPVALPRSDKSVTSSPTEVPLMEALPRNAVGKVAKPELRERVKQ